MHGRPSCSKAAHIALCNQRPSELLCLRTDGCITVSPRRPTQRLYYPMLPLLLIAEVFKLEQQLRSGLAPSPFTWVTG